MLFCRLFFATFGFQKICLNEESEEEKCEGEINEEAQAEIFCSLLAREIRFWNFDFSHTDGNINSNQHLSCLKHGYQSS